MSTDESRSLRERKKLATREALSAAALRLALTHGPENVRVDDIAEAAGVSPRTYNNYFSSREQAIVAAITAERALRIAAAVRARPADEPLAEAVVEALVEQYGEPPADMLLLIMSAPGLRAEYVDTVAAIEQPLASAIAARTGSQDDLATTVLAAAVSAAARVGVGRWVSTVPSTNLVVPRGVLADTLRAALTHVLPALRAADPRLG